MGNDGFIDKAGEVAREIFGKDEQRSAGESVAGQPRRKAADYPMGGDPAVASHYGAQGGQEVRVGGEVASDRGRYDDDPHYQQTRASHLGAFDRDYDAYRREHASADGAADAGANAGKSRPDFAAWRQKRSGEQDANSLALGESPSQGSDGPHILDRSFSGTYDGTKD